MPRFRRTKKAPRRRIAYRRFRVGRRLVSRRPIGYMSKHGVLSISRKLNAIKICQNTTAGNALVTDPTTSCLSVGAGVAVPGVNFTYDVPFAMKFRLDQLINSSDITNLCDQYKIVSALVKIHCNYNNTNTANNVLAQPWIEYTQDYDDAEVPPSVTLFRQKMGLKTKYFSASRPVIGMGVRPRIRLDVGRDYTTGTTALALVGNRKQWINSSFNDVDHFGIKGVIHNMFLPGGGSAVGSLFDVEVVLKVIAKDFQ